jgi:type VI secretion system secreted protein Hcp
MPIYMRYDGLFGPVVRQKQRWVELQSVQFGSTRSTNSSSGRGSNREASGPSVSEIVVTKLQDAASTDLFREAVWGEGKKVVIHFVKDDPQDGPKVTEKEAYLVIELENVLISGFSVSGGNGNPNALPMESMSLNFTKITYINPSAAKPPPTPRWNTDLVRNPG